MPGGSTTTQNQSGTTAPYAPAQPLLQNIAATLQSMPTSVTPQQTSALNTLNAATSNLPNYTPQASNVASNEFNYNTNPQQNIETNALTGINTTLSPYLSSSYLNPTTTPGLSTQLQGVGNTISNQINDQFAAAGRDLSPGNTTALAYGLEQGEAPILTNQYNANVAAQEGAASTAFGAANTAAGGLTTQQLAQMGINTGGLTTAQQIPGVATAPGSAALSAANTTAEQPYQNLGWLSSLAYPLGALGGQSTQQGTTTQQNSLLSTILGGTLGGLGLLGSNPGSSTNPTTGATATTGGSGLLGLWNQLSDRNAKKNVHRIGMLYDGSPVFSYEYIGSDVPQMGLMAQEVEKERPDAVVEIGGLKHVDYGKATERARHYGMLADLDMAA